MSDQDIPDQHPDHFARRYDKARGWLAELVSLAVAVAAIHRTAPDGFVASAVIFVGAYFLTHFIADVMWLASETALGLVTVLIYFSTIWHLFIALPPLPAVLLSLFMPGIAQAYVIWDLWPATSDPLHPFTLFCMIWLVLLAAYIFKPIRFRRLQAMIAARRRRRA